MSDRTSAIASIRRGWSLHSEGGTDDPDLALLEGDRLYADGLEQLAEQGDLEAITALADVISLCARSHAEGRPEMAQDAWANAARLNRTATSAQPYSSER